MKSPLIKRIEITLFEVRIPNIVTDPSGFSVWYEPGSGIIQKRFSVKIFSDDVSKATELNGLLMTLFFMGLTGALLVKDLDRPDRFLYVLLRPQWRSWLVKGAYIITVFGLIVTLLLIDNFFEIVEKVNKTGRNSLLLKIIRDEKSLWVTIKFHR